MAGLPVTITVGMGAFVGGCCNFRAEALIKGELALAAVIKCKGNTSPRIPIWILILKMDNRRKSKTATKEAVSFFSDNNAKTQNSGVTARINAFHPFLRGWLPRKLYKAPSTVYKISIEAAMAAPVVVGQMIGGKEFMQYSGLKKHGGVFR